MQEHSTFHGVLHLSTPLPVRPCCIAASGEFGYTVPMPTVMRVGAYRLFFYSADGGEPAHIHVERDGRTAKLWLDPVRLAASGGFRRSGIREIERIVTDDADSLIEAWNEHFGS